MTSYLIKAKIREIVGKKVKKIRPQGDIPAVVYGQGIKNQNLSVNNNEFAKIHDQAGQSGIIDLQVGDAKPVKTLIHDLQLDPTTDKITHVDFYQIQEGKKLTTKVELEFINEAPAVKEFGGILVKNYDEVEIECLPVDLEKIKTITVDLSVLKNIGDAVHFKDLIIPKDVKILNDLNESIVMVFEPQEEKFEEVVAPVAEAEVVGEEGKEADAQPAEEEKKPAK